VANGDHAGRSSTAERAAVLRNDAIGGDAFLGIREAFADGVADLVDAAAERTHGILGASALAPLLLAAEALTTVAMEVGWSSVKVDRVVHSAAAASGLATADARRQIFLHATRNPRILELPPRFAMEFQLALLANVGAVHEVTLWAGTESSRVECVASVGSSAPTRRVRTVARLTLSPDAEHDPEQGLICGIRVLRWQRPHAALVLRRSAGDERAIAFARETAGALAPIFERELLLERNVRRERTLVEASEKRLARIGYDIHDGPLQDIAILLADLQLARRDLGRHLGPREERIVDGRLQDLESHVVEVNRSLRELAVSLEPRHVLESPFASVVEREVDAFARRTGIDAGLDVNGDFTELTASQRLALYRVIQEALTNVREHSGATVVHVSLESRRSSTELRVIDNGTGFEVTRVLIDAARRGRLGLVGIGERVRMLGGTFDVVSRPENYTELYVSLPVWRPVAEPAAEQLDVV
jgi:signal transduction histidine kinase